MKRRPSSNKNRRPKQGATDKKVKRSAVANTSATSESSAKDSGRFRLRKPVKLRKPGAAAASKPAAKDNFRVKSPKPSATTTKSAKIKFAKPSDCADILKFIRALAKYEKLEQEVTATEQKLKNTLFGPKPAAEVIFLEESDGTKAAFALFFHNYSTFLAKPGVYLEDLFVIPKKRGKGYGKRLLSFLAKLSVERGCGRLEWWVLNWNKPALDFYKMLGAESMPEWTVQRVTGAKLTALAEKSED